MFYQTHHSEVLRQGDVVEGYISTRPTITSPRPFTKQTEQLCTVDIEIPSYSVVLSPCCSIEDGVICLTPLIPINNKILRNDHLREDPTVINAIVKPEYTAPSYVWNKPEFQEEKLKRLAAGEGYVFNYYFAYEGNDIFQYYTVDIRGKDNITTNCYIIDFRNIYSLMCDMIKRQSALTDHDKPLIESKRLELSVETRHLLRNKLSYYFWRPAPEDEALIS